MGKHDDPLGDGAKAIGHGLAKAGKALKDDAKAVGKYVKDAVKRIPDLIRKDEPNKSPSKFTLYLKIGDGSFSQAKTGVFVPKSIVSAAKVNLILYLHGNKVRVVHKDYSIEEIWGV